MKKIYTDTKICKLKSKIVAKQCKLKTMRLYSELLKPQKN